MRDSENAAEHLRVIRQLMERATVYRAISAPTALGGGCAAIALAAWQHFKGVSWQGFLASWLSLFVLLSFVNLALLWRDARQRGQPFFSSGMRLALRALAPPLFAGGVIGIVSAWQQQPLALTASYWAVFYGLALLATSSFSPPSITLLGRAMSLWGLLFFLGQYSRFPDEWMTAPAIMGVTFGLHHVIYGLSVCRKNQSKAS